MKRNLILILSALALSGFAKLPAMSEPPATGTDTPPPPGLEGGSGKSMVPHLSPEQKLALDRFNALRRAGEIRKAVDEAEQYVLRTKKEDIILSAFLGGCDELNQKDRGDKFVFDHRNWIKDDSYNSTRVARYLVNRGVPLKPSLLRDTEVDNYQKLNEFRPTQPYNFESGNELFAVLYNQELFFYKSGFQTERIEGLLATIERLSPDHIFTLINKALLHFNQGRRFIRTDRAEYLRLVNLANNEWQAAVKRAEADQRWQFLIYEIRLNGGAYAIEQTALGTHSPYIGTNEERAAERQKRQDIRDARNAANSQTVEWYSSQSAIIRERRQERKETIEQMLARHGQPLVAN